jgi:hypothetical protein
MMKSGDFGGQEIHAITTSWALNQVDISYESFIPESISGDEDV